MPRRPPLSRFPRGRVPAASRVCGLLAVLLALAGAAAPLASAWADLAGDEPSVLVSPGWAAAAAGAAAAGVLLAAIGIGVGRRGRVSALAIVGMLLSAGVLIGLLAAIVVPAALAGSAP